LDALFRNGGYNILQRTGLLFCLLNNQLVIIFAEVKSLEVLIVVGGIVTMTPNVCIGEVGIFDAGLAWAKAKLKT